MKLRSLVLVILILAMAAPVLMLADSKAEKEVLAVVTELQQATMKDPAAAAASFDKYLADDFTLIMPNGTLLTKPVIMEGWRSGATTYQKFDLSDLKVRIYGNTAVVTGVATNMGTQADYKATYVPTRFTRVLVKRDGVWRCVSLQNTRIEQQARQ